MIRQRGEKVVKETLAVRAICSLHSCSNFALVLHEKCTLADQTRVIFSCKLLLTQKETFNLNKVLTNDTILERKYLLLP